MEFAYYPGCSLEHTGRPYDASIRSAFAALDVGLRDVEDWNCCGATMYMSARKTVGYSLSARNLALAAAMGLDVCAPCSSCYTILRKTNRHMAAMAEGRERIRGALAAAGLDYDGQVQVRHPLDILVNDVGIPAVAARVTDSLAGLRVAPYYGCQIVRPHAGFDDVDDPRTLDDLLTALGAEVVPYPGKVRCCGGMLMLTSEEVALDLNHGLLQCAEAAGATVLVTTCPLCQINLEAYQDVINRRHGAETTMPVVYFSQLVGRALGLDDRATGLDSMLVPLPEYRRQAEVGTS